MIENDKKGILAVYLLGVSCLLISIIFIINNYLILGAVELCICIIEFAGATYLVLKNKENNKDGSNEYNDKTI